MFGKSVMYVRRKIVLDNIPMEYGSVIDTTWLGYAINVLNDCGATIENIEISTSGKAEETQRLKVSMYIRCRAAHWGMIEEQLESRYITVREKPKVEKITTEVY